MRFSSVELDATSLAALATHEADTTAVHGIVDTSDLVTKSGVQTIAGQKTHSSPLLLPDGSAAAPAAAFATDPDTGSYRSGANEFAIAAGGAQRLRIGSLVAAFAPFAMAGSFNMAAQSIGSTLNLSTATYGLLVVSQATSRINLFNRYWGATPFRFVIVDPLGYLGTGSLTIHPYDDGFWAFNDINGAEATYGAWYDPLMSSYGPAGNDAVITGKAGCTIALDGALNNTGSGAEGGWNVQIVVPDMSY